MKQILLRRQPLGSAAPALLLCAGLFLACTSTAQNLIKNGDFELPLGPTNWTVGYLHGGPDDWEIKDRNRGGSRHAAWYGGYLRCLTLKLAHAYFTQTVTNLTPGYAYTVTGWMREDWWKGLDDAKRDKYLVYIEAIGGNGTPTTDGRASVLATNDFDPDADIDPPYTYATSVWRPFSAQQVPDASGRIEIRLHYNRVSFVIYDKNWISAASYDDVSLTP